MREPDGLFKLTMGVGGVLTELMQDTVSLLLPVTEADLQGCLEKLRIYKLLSGYRGQSGISMPALTDAVMKLCEWVEANLDQVAEVEINPLLCFTDKVIVADALVSASLQESL